MSFEAKIESAGQQSVEVAQIDALIHELTEQRNLLVQVKREVRVGSHWVRVREELDVQRATTLLAAYRLFEVDGLYDAYEAACQDAGVAA